MSLQLKMWQLFVLVNILLVAVFASHLHEDKSSHTVLSDTQGTIQRQQETHLDKKRLHLHRSAATKGDRMFCGTSTRRPKATLDSFFFTETPEGNRFRRDTPTGEAVYFTGRSDALRYRSSQNSIQLPRHEFSVSLWVKPAGGQNTPAVIIGLLDSCRNGGRQWTWSLGIDTHQEWPARDAHFFFSVTTDRSHVGTVVRGRVKYEPQTWTHLAASYDGRTLTLYVNGAKEAMELGAAGLMFSEVMQECKQLMLGGGTHDEYGFRGVLDRVVIWPTAKIHRDLKDVMHSVMQQEGAIIAEDFEGNWENWAAAGDSEPMAVPSDISGELLRLTAKIPPCGVTVCDSPIVASAYTNQSELGTLKTIKYHAITMAEDDGSNPTMDHRAILHKHDMVNQAFTPHNISWELTQFVVRNSSLRSRLVLPLCNINYIGDGVCDDECRYGVTGDDAGDCIDTYYSVCLDEQIGNGICEDVCNTGANEYDGGDCCELSITDVTRTCFDPRSLNRNYLTVGELKGIIGIESDTHLNVYFVNFADRDMEGMATMPWDLDVHGLSGGTVLKAESCDSEQSSETIVHELGHNLGLWHVHEGMECNARCMEKGDSSILGDLVADTNPTPENYNCRDPKSCDTASCFGDIEFKDTPYTNFMGYADAECTDHFTQQQGARMHCYIDLVFQNWLKVPTRPLGIPLSLRVASEDANSVTLSWLPPVQVSRDEASRDSLCHRCTVDHRLAQYANTAQFFSSSTKTLPFYSAPEELTGPPDANFKCEPSYKSWSASASEARCEDCYLKLGFKTAVAPSKLILWANYNTKGGISNLELEYKDGNIESLGPIEVFCDMPYTLRLTHIEKKVRAIRVYPGRPFFNLDAVQLVSVADWSGCEGCSSLNYRLFRDPPFTDGQSSQNTESTVFTDSDIVDSITYSYRLQVFQDNEIGLVTSQPLYHKRGQEFCGNGRQERGSGEECDDGNISDGDGCSLYCQIEDGYICKGKTSLCSHVSASTKDNQVFVDSYLADSGLSFTDQWAEAAVANPMHQSKENPVTALLGRPHTSKCGAVVDNGLGWYPIDLIGDEDYWIRVRFAKPAVATAIIVHLSADGLLSPGSDPTRLSLELIGPEGQPHGRPITSYPVTCQDSPVHFGITHDLNKQFAPTKEVLIRLSSYTIAISAVRLRSRDSLDPETIASCQSGQLYNPAAGRCVSYSCQWPECGPLTTIPHTIANCSGNREGDVCSVRCQTGYSSGSLHTDAQMVCLGSEWRGPDIICKAVDCGQPSLPHAEVVCASGTTYGKHCKLKCIPPAKMQGSLQTITCMTDGLYSLPEAYCQLQCDVPYVVNAMLISPQCQAGSHNIGTVCKFHCDVGHHVSGQRSGRRNPQKLRYKCSDDASWTGPTCELVVCEQPPMIFDDLYTCTDGFNYNSECRLRCDHVVDDSDEVVSMIRCIQDDNDPSRGVWDGDFTRCRSLQGSCQPPHSNTNVELRCENGHTIGSQCAIICPDIFGLADKEPALLAVNSSVYYVSDRDWTRANHVITCTAQRHWFPDPMRIICVEICFKDEIANGICQQVNNRAYCNWDGGDCCTSTNIYGMVLTTRDHSSAEDNAMCFDPNAHENQQGTNGSHRKNRP